MASDCLCAMRLHRDQMHGRLWASPLSHVLALSRARVVCLTLFCISLSHFAASVATLLAYGPQPGENAWCMLNRSRISTAHICFAVQLYGTLVRMPAIARDLGLTFGSDVCQRWCKRMRQWHPYSNPKYQWPPPSTPSTSVARQLLSCGQKSSREGL